MFEHVDAYAGDPILTLNENFQKDPRPGRINLSIGIYFDDAGRLPVMQAVREAETALLQSIGPRGYLPMTGLAEYRTQIQHLLFGADHEAVTSGRTVTIQSLGGSGALKVGADFLRKYFPASQVWISDPTWENHLAIFEGAGLHTHSYPYYDPATGGLRFDAMLEQGFEAEVRQLFERGDLSPDLPSIRCVGYRQMWDYLAGVIDYDEMRYRGTVATNQLAKRQLTWLRGWSHPLTWLETGSRLNPDIILRDVGSCE